MRVRYADCPPNDGREPPFPRHILQEFLSQHENQLEMIWRRGSLTSYERIMAFLVMATDIMPVELLPDGNLLVTVELSRRDRADLENTNVETISRTFSQLAAMDLVNTAAPARYRVCDLARLALFGGNGSGPGSPLVTRPA